MNEAEIHELGYIVRRTAFEQDDVRRFDIAVNQFVPVGFAQRSADLPQNVENAIGGHRPESANHVFEALPGEVLHHVVKRPVVRSAIVVNFNGVRVAEPGGGLDLAFEAADLIRVIEVFRVNPFNGTRAFQEVVLGEIDFAHAARAEPTTEAILPQFANHLPRFFDLFAKGSGFRRTEDGECGGGYQRRHGDDEQNERVVSGEDVRSDGNSIDEQSQCRHRSDHSRSADERIRHEYTVKDDERDPIQVRNQRDRKDENLLVLPAAFEPFHGGGGEYHELPICEK